MFFWWMIHFVNAQLHHIKALYCFFRGIYSREQWLTSPVYDHLSLKVYIWYDIGPTSQTKQPMVATWFVCAAWPMYYHTVSSTRDTYMAFICLWLQTYLVRFRILEIDFAYYKIKEIHFWALLDCIFTINLSILISDSIYAWPVTWT